MKKTVALDQVKYFHLETDVVVCGFGGAGACAALEARQHGADVIVLERFSDGGGSTELSACEMYLGGSGGTSLQRELGFQDSSENFRAYLLQCFGENHDPERLNAYTEGAAEHFDWMESQGVPYKRGFFGGRDVVAMTGDSLQYTGNERAWPFNLVSEPVPRGHLPADSDHNGGKVLMGVLKKRVHEADAEVIVDARVGQLIMDDDGRVCGVGAKIDNEMRYIRARKGVVLTMGGFIMNERMTRRHIPRQESFATRHGNPGDMGDGIALGVAAGGNAINMGEAFIGVAHYPPADLTYGIFVNQAGQRFVNEDVYLARMGEYVFRQQGRHAYLFIDNAHYSRPAYHDTTEIVAVGETVEEVEQEAGLPAGSLQQTLAYYNANAEGGEDPLFNKSADWLIPLTEPPFALIDFSLDKLQPTVFTLGGLETRSTGEVVSPDGNVIPGLYAAGRTAAGIPRTGEGYASGMSVGDATFFGRLAGRQAALEG